MSDVPPTAPAVPPGAPKESRAGRLLALVRKLIDYGKELAATLQRDPANRPRHFGATDIALLLARIAQGLHHARALEDRLLRNATRLDAPPRPRRTSSPPKPRAAPPPAPHRDNRDPRVADLPTPEQIAAHATGPDAEVRRRPIGVVLADICRDLGILPSHPLWPELSELIVRHGGSLANLLKDIIAKAGRRIAEAWTAAMPPAPYPAVLSPAGAGPPDPWA
jgi:hypothetical protein